VLLQPQIDVQDSDGYDGYRQNGMQDKSSWSQSGSTPLSAHRFLWFHRQARSSVVWWRPQ